MDKPQSCDVLVVGAGLAGLNAAAEIREKQPGMRVLVVDAGGCASTEVMGFSAPVNPPDSPDMLYFDILRAGGGYSAAALARVLADRSLPELRRLERMGLVFDRCADGSYDMVNALGSSHPRVVHQATTTGRQAMELLATAVTPLRVSKLLLADGRIAGVLTDAGEAIAAKAVVLAGGGFAGLWQFSTWSKTLCGDCLCLAQDAGAELIDLGFVQFEPTVTVYPEALRGFSVLTAVLNEGARLLNCQGESILPAAGPLPRKSDLARIIMREIEAGNACAHGGIRFDYTQVDEAAFARKYPAYHAKYRRFAPSLAELGQEVVPAAHTTLGGIRVTPDCATAVPGLFAAGEAMGGLHGADRVGGNAGLEVFVFGRIAGASAAAYAARSSQARLPRALPTPLRTPDDVYGRMAEILQRGFTPLRKIADLERAAQELAGLGAYGPVMLATAAVADALSKERARAPYQLDHAAVVDVPALPEGQQPGDDFLAPVWQRAASLRIDRVARTDFYPPHFPLASCRLFYDDDWLYLNYEVTDRYVQCLSTEFGQMVFRDSCVEFFAEPLPGLGYINFEFNCGGNLHVAHIRDCTLVPGGFKDHRVFREDELSGIEIVHSLPRRVSPEITTPVTWHVLVRIPIAFFEKALGRPLRPLAGTQWRANFNKCASGCSHPHWLTWSQLLERNMHRPQDFGIVRFV
ncbi:carbohydrate-binding family 9-like protein [Oligosphaera ethanolica]|uniref:L-aspartate oxidase n=1 Tax=Oligosphaera ethanolica TaxID=760260 RepID=A0AAE3VDN5_9BACT|nr:carbohydrate-binding family 9-like protein [Oligosphaera ethanolica]MDQ0288617.1 aspartate oxidase [Oligosphaera ethanolica]